MRTTKQRLLRIHLNRVMILAGGFLLAFNTHAAKGGKGKPGDGGGGGGGDSIPPSQITDLVADNSGEWAPFYRLSWTVVGDDLMTGNVAAYDVRYIVGEQLTESNWNIAINLISATQLFLVSPQRMESFIVYDLPQGTACSVGIKAIDEAGNASSLSNVVSVTTAGLNWSTEIVDVLPWESDRWTYSTAMATSSSGVIGLAIGKDDGVYLKEKSDSDAVWAVAQLVDNQMTSPYIYVHFLDYDTNGNPTIVYDNEGAIFMARKAETQWHIERVDTGYWGGMDVISDPWGNHWLSYSAEVGKGKNKHRVLKIATRDPLSKSWYYEIIDDTAKGYVHTALAWGSQGPLMAYRAVLQISETETQSELRYAQWNELTDSWEHQHIGYPNLGVDHDIAIDPQSGMPVIAFSNSADKLTLLEKGTDKGIWFEEIITGNCYSVAGFKIDSSGTRMLVVQMGQALRFIYDDPHGSWFIEPVVGSNGDQPNSFVFTSEGLPAIAGYDADSRGVFFSQKIPTMP